MSPNRAGVHRRVAIRSRLRSSALLALSATALVAGCASLPPAAPVEDVRALAGSWEGELMTRNGPYRFTSTIGEDGSSMASLPAIPPGTFQGRYSVDKGAIRFVSLTTGRTSTCTFHRNDSQRVLACRADDGATTSEARSR